MTKACEADGMEQTPRRPRAAMGIRFLVYLSVCLIPIIIFCRYQYVPFDDCIRHAAKAVSGRSWNEILVLREGITMDQHPGWHRFLGTLHSQFGAGKEELVLVEWTLLFLLASLSVVPLFRRPEAWVAALLLAGLAFPDSYIFRLTRGRPYIFTEAALLVLLVLWGSAERKKTALFVTTTALLALTTWIHGAAWYLWILPILALALSERFRDAAFFGACWAAGITLGAALTGHPVDYLTQQVRHAFLALGTGNMARMLVGEFQPFSGGMIYLLALGFVCLVRRVCLGAWMQDRGERLFCTLGVLGWLGGLYVSRLWTEWGLPACQLWMAFMIQDLLVTAGPKRLATQGLTAAGLCLAFVLSATGDLGGRWSGTTAPPASVARCSYSVCQGSPAAEADKNGWLPGPGGIVYNSEMDIFTLLFFQHPTGLWRYAYGFESGLMTDDNLKVLRNIQLNYGDWSAFQPWVDKLTRADRLIVRSPIQPPIATLEWKEYQKSIWIGRQP